MKRQIEIINGECIEEMKKLPANSVDSIICDPPYGLEFMGKKWDKFKKGNTITKPQGAYENKKGFKKMVRMPSNIQTLITYQEWTTNWAKEALRVAKPGATLMAFGGTRTYHRLACAIEDAGWEIFDCIFWAYGSGFPKSLDISKQIDKVACRKQLTEKLGRNPTLKEFEKEWKKFRKVVGKRYNGMAETAMKPDKGWNSNKMGREINVLVPTTPEAKLWNGWGTALKPAVEPIIVARKPKEGTYAENALKWGVAGLNIDGARIEIESEKVEVHDAPKGTFAGGEQNRGSIKNYRENLKGRFPSNLILDEEAAKVVDEQSNNASHFFKRIIYTPKASKRERNAGCEGLEKKQRDESRKQGNPGGDNPRNRGVKKVLNNHPTVKPVKLMEYLCTLTKTPTGGVVLDPFMGSGTTGIACINMGRDFIGIEKDKEYCKIAEARLKYWQKKQEEKLF